MGNFKKFIKTTSKCPRGYYISIRRNYLAFSMPFKEIFHNDEIKYCELFTDIENNRFAMKFLKEHGFHSYIIQNKYHRNNPHVNAKTFISHYNLPGGRFEAKFNEELGMWIVDYDEEKEDV